MKKLQRNFFLRDSLRATKELLWKYIVRETKEHKIIMKIVDVECYRWVNDKACHAYWDKKTDRTKSMYNLGWFSYIYQIYWHSLLNVVLKEKGKPHAALIRACQPISWIDIIEKRRSGQKGSNLTNGPGKLTQALWIGKYFDNIDLIESDKLYLTFGESVKDDQIEKWSRINIDYAEEYVDKPWRFRIKNNEYVSN